MVMGNLIVPWQLQSLPRECGNFYDNTTGAVTSIQWYCENGNNGRQKCHNNSNGFEAVPGSVFFLECPFPI